MEIVLLFTSFGAEGHTHCLGFELEVSHSLSEYITPGGLLLTRVATFRSVLSTYCSTAYQTLFASQYSLCVPKAHILLCSAFHGLPFWCVCMRLCVCVCVCMRVCDHSNASDFII